MKVGNRDIHLPFEVEIPASKEGGAVRIVLDETTEGIRATEVHISASPGCTVRAADLRRIPVARYALEAVIERCGVPAFTDSERARIRDAGPVEDSLSAVATVYEAAHAVGMPPARQVEIELGLPRTTASKWIRRARESGLIASPSMTPSSPTTKGTQP